MNLINKIDEIQRVLMAVEVKVSEAPKLIGIINELEQIKTEVNSDGK